jgi:hypothetical protein
VPATNEELTAAISVLLAAMTANPYKQADVDKASASLDALVKRP